MVSAQPRASSHLKRKTINLIQSSFSNKSRQVSGIIRPHVDAFLKKLSHLIIQAADWIKEHPTEAATRGAIIIIVIVLLAASPQILAAIGFTHAGPAAGKARIVKLRALLLAALGWPDAIYRNGCRCVAGSFGPHRRTQPVLHPLERGYGRIWREHAAWRGDGGHGCWGACNGHLEVVLAVGIKRSTREMQRRRVRVPGATSYGWSRGSWRKIWTEHWNNGNPADG